MVFKPQNSTIVGDFFVRQREERAKSPRMSRSSSLFAGEFEMGLDRDTFLFDQNQILLEDINDKHIKSD